MRVKVDDFHENGFLVVSSLLDSELIQGLRESWSLIEEALASDALSPLGLTQPKGRGDLYVHNKEKNFPGALRDLYKNEKITSIVKQILGDENLCLYMYRMVVKGFGQDYPVTMHQDLGFFHGGTKKLNVFIPLAHIDDQNGGLSFVSGSQKLGFIGRETIAGTAVHEPNMHAPSVDCGDIILADILTFHQSSEQVVKTPRPYMQIIYQPSSDGSIYPSLPNHEPTLASGKWKTDQFIKFHPSITLDPVT